MTTTPVGVEEPATTRVERFLSVVLAVFVFVGLVWAYVVPCDRTEDSFSGPLTNRPPAVVQRDDAQGALFRAQADLQQAEADEVTARESYRTTLDAGTPDPALEQAYEAAQARTAKAREVERAAQVELDRVRPAGDAAEKAALDADQGSRDDDERTTFLLRLALVLGSLVVSYALFEVMRRRQSRNLQNAMAVLAAAVALSVVMAVDYLELDEAGPLFLSLAGIALTIAVSVAYQRYLAKRLPARRVRKGECPFCGYPSGDREHCEGCGRAVTGACTTCGNRRRVAARHCGACGAA